MMAVFYLFCDGGKKGVPFISLWWFNSIYLLIFDSATSGAIYVKFKLNAVLFVSVLEGFSIILFTIVGAMSFELRRV